MLPDYLKLKRGKAFGMRSSPEYQTWLNIRQRCYNPSDKKYQYYGGRGVTVCASWLQSFQAFFQDMGKRPTKRHSIDRIDNRKGYTPTNCRWATKAVQIKNRSTTYKTLDKNGNPVKLGEDTGGTIGGN